MAGEDSPTGGIDRRLHERKQVYLPARIESSAATCLGVMRDISACGGCLVVNRPIEVGTDIRVILTGGVERSGVVRRCVPVPGAQKFAVGFEVIEVGWPESLLPSDDQ